VIFKVQGVAEDLVGCQSVAGERFVNGYPGDDSGAAAPESSSQRYLVANQQSRAFERPASVIRDEAGDSPDEI
jgi:hypothetical protein